MMYTVLLYNIQLPNLVHADKNSGWISGVKVSGSSLA